MKNIFELTAFSAGEAEAITGVSGQVQRDWRRRGILPEIKRPARHDVLALAEMLALKALGERGIGPQVAKRSFPALPVAIATAALLNTKAFAGVPNLDGKAIVEIAKRIRVEKFRFADQPPRFFITWADGSHDWADNLSRRFDVLCMANAIPSVFSADTGNLISGAIVLVDTLALGNVLLQRAGRALATVHSQKKRKGESHE